MNKAMAMAVTVMVTVTNEVMFGEMRRRFSFHLVNKKVSNGCWSYEIKGEVGFQK